MASESISPSLSPEAALVFLSLPDADGLSAEQQRGAVCVWDNEHPLTVETAIDLGERQHDGRLWFPRADRRCINRQALAALHLHSQLCEQCTDDYRGCQEGYGLVRLVRVMRG